MLSVLDYAVAHLHVKQGWFTLVPAHRPTALISYSSPVIVVGHTECGGAKYCVEESRHAPPIAPPKTPLERWLGPLTTLARDLRLGSLPPSEAVPILVEENVKRQVQNLVETETVKAAWGRGEDVCVRGLVYDLATGRLSDLGVAQRRPQ